MVLTPQSSTVRQANFVTHKLNRTEFRKLIKSVDTKNIYLAVNHSGDKKDYVKVTKKCLQDSLLWQVMDGIELQTVEQTRYGIHVSYNYTNVYIG